MLLPPEPHLFAERDVWAAVDLGSNNFQMLIVRRVHDEIVVVDRLKDKVQLLQGMAAHRLQPSAIERGLQVLRRYHQRLREIPPSRLSVVGTFALRFAENRAEFLVPAQGILGQPVEVLSGHDEARLIDLAVSRHLDDALERSRPDSQRLVLDIGGGSTELARSEWESGRRELVEATSIPLGCVALMDQFFSHSEVVGRAYPQAREWALSLLQELGVQSANGADVVGTSGTLESIVTVCEASGFSRGEVSADALRRVEDAIVGGLWLADFGIPGLPPERVDIFPAGVAILSAFMETLEIERVRFCSATLPHGVLYAGMGLGADNGSVLEAVVATAARFGVDPAQGDRIRRQALTLLQSLVDGIVDERHEQILVFAAMLLEIGLHIGVQGYHRHGAYILQHSEIRGLSPKAKEALVMLVRCHRRTWPSGLQTEGERLGYRQLADVLISVRLAVILERSHTDLHSPEGVVLSRVDSELVLRLPTGWLAAHPLSADELSQEQHLLKGQGINLRLA